MDGYRSVPNDAPYESADQSTDPGRFGQNSSKLAGSVHEVDSYFRQIANAIPIGLFVVQNDTIKYANPAILYFTGISPQCFTMEAWNQLLDKSSRKAFARHMMNVEAGYPASSIDLKLAPAMQDAKWVDFWGLKIEYDGSPAQMAMLYDISRKREIENSLLESTERFMRLAENAADMIFRWSFGHGFEYVSSASVEVTGYTPKEYYRDPGLFYRLIHRDDISIYESVFLTEPAHPRQECVIRIKHRSGHYVHIEMRMSPIFDAREDLICIEGIARDISQHITAQQQLRELTARVTRAAEEERRRIARELHDEIGQSLTAAKMRVRMAEKALVKKPDVLAEKLEKLAILLDDTLQTVRNLSHNLRPPLLDEAGWEPAILALARQFSQATDIPVRVRRTGLESLRLDPEVELTAYRTVQEALTNVAKHSKAKAVTLSIDVSAEKLSISIKDNGKGMDTDPPNRAGLGLLSMKERADLVGGECSIVSTSGKGTLVTIHLPRTSHHA